MDTHTTEPVTEPTVSGQTPEHFESNSFEAALDAAFNNLDRGGEETGQEDRETETEIESGGEEEIQGTEEWQTDETEETEDDPFEQLTEETDWTPKAAKRFKQIKEELRNSNSELEQLRQIAKEQDSALKELAALAEDKDVEELQNRVKEYENAQMFANLESSSVYQDVVTKPLGDLMERADQIAVKYDIDPTVLIDIIALGNADEQDERLSEIMPDASDRDKSRIYRIIEEVGPILERRQVLFENVEEASKEVALLEETRQKQDLAERAKLRDNVTRNVVDRVTEKLPFVKSMEGFDIEAIRRKAASVDPTVIHPVDFAYNAVSAQLLPSIVREYMSLRREVESLTDKLAEFGDAEPKMSGYSGSPSKQSGGDGNFIDAINRAFGG